MPFTSERIDFEGKTDAEILAILQHYKLALKVEEAKKIQFEILKRPPSVAEMVLWSIQGSEHCSYKSSRPFLGLFPTKGPDVILGPKEDSGIIELTKDAKGHRYGVVLSHESHNHPSQLVPYEGAATGVGGNVRDVCCMGARVIAVADGLRFGEIDHAKAQWIADGVVSGIAGYGNPLGIPNIAGDAYFHKGYNENCLVTVLTLGILREDALIHSYAPANAEGYKLILVGKPTDNSGFGGASFASLELEEEKKEQNKGAVQEPNAFLERHILKSSYALFDWLHANGQINRVGFKDLGAGGIACASVELADAAGYGADVDLDAVHVSMQDLPDAVKLCSETQERFMWVVPDDLVEVVLNHYNKTFDFPGVSHGARASVIGTIRGDGMFRVTAGGHTIVEARAEDVTRGLIYNREHHYTRKPLEASMDYAEPESYAEMLEKVVTHPDVASRWPIYKRYDKQVQGSVVIQRGAADAGVLQPFVAEEWPDEIRKVGVAVAMTQNPRYCLLDAYWGSVLAVIEGTAKLASVGATPIALSDCLCFGNPEKPGQMGEFVEAIRGISDACRGISLKDHPEHPLPIVSGNVSLYNETREGSIPPSPIIGAIGKVKDVSHVVTPGFKKPDSLLYFVGESKAELAGSIYHSVIRQSCGSLPKVDFAEWTRTLHTLVDLIGEGVVLSCKANGLGGLAACLAQMSFMGDAGCRVRMESGARRDQVLFSEHLGFVIEVCRENAAFVEDHMKKNRVTLRRIGETAPQGQFEVQGVRITDMKDLKRKWQFRLLDN